MGKLAAAAMIVVGMSSFVTSRATAQQSAGTQFARGVIDGAVTDTALAPVEGATITVFQTDIRVTTGASGRFRIQQMPAGQYLVIVQRIGFRPASGIIEVPANDTARLAYSLERAVANLAPTVVTEKYVSMNLVDFEYRRRIGLGQFMTQEQIAQHGSVYVTELVRQFMGVKVIPRSGGGGMMQSVAISTRVGAGTKDTFGCPLQIFVDGIRQIGLVNLDNLPPPNQLAGIEMYPGPAEVPLQYAGDGTRCGVMLIWSKSGL